MRYPIHTSFGRGNIQALSICKEIAELVPPEKGELLFDFTPYVENNPFGNLAIINSLRRFKALYPDADLRCRPKEQNGYLSHIGFYKAIGLDYGKDPGEAIANSNYVPITEINLNHGDFYQTIENKANELAATLRFDRGLQQFISYTFIETIRNVFEHANTNHLFVAAQKWPTYNLVEIAISDSGCGINGSLGKTYAIKQEDLLRLACLPGISAKSNHIFLERDDLWRNSGYGLYTIKELALAYGGSFILCSGNKAIRYYSTPFSKEEGVFDTDYSGTTVGIRFATDTLNDFKRVREGIIQSGENDAARIEGAIKKASLSSGGRYYFDRVDWLSNKENVDM